ncbi:hypothetical protein PAXRUDRAFT_148540 [Paxillus rubicundulus Ve08.2h10]|uniref:F-box domain-containing protein n=1 Tax=Paxillus rubicundulus Ve08.2h10 TaxID=930991 RepID=A0A0D0E3Y4_9AGAM|nr:hypothetical protein PAXRUDRAFT_148540 [Paxillus rubicundulus Ve08.2h10]
MSSQPTLLTLPFEVIEWVLISSRSPRSVSSLAQTCRMLRTIVYASPDSHLWRELFLSIWDDPRPALQHRALIDPRVAEHTRDWGVEYRRRVVAEKWLKSWRSNVSSVYPFMPPLASVISKEAALLPTLRTLLDTFLTMTPFPASPTMSLTALTPNLEPRMARAPPFPPLLLLLASGLEVIPPSRSGVRLGRIVYGPHASRTRTIAGAHRFIPTPSLPPQLTRTLLGSPWHSAHLPFLRGIEIGTGDEVGEVFHHIVCITGFVPIPPPLPTAPAPSSASTSTPSDFPTRAEQYADARRLAKRRVYDMQYLRGDRMWGPYQVVERDILDLDVGGQHGGVWSLGQRSRGDTDDGNDADGEEEGLHGGEPVHVEGESIKPHHLKPDYVYLASVRIVAEANLREIFKLTDLLAAIRNIEVARIGGACGYWGEWIGKRGEGTGEEGRTGGRRQPRGEACEGWDWAGVSGLWRRVLPFSFLRVSMSLDRSKFLTLDSTEAHRIIPMEFHITGYTRAGLVPIPEPKDTHDDTTRHNGPHTRMRTRYFRPPPIIQFTGSSIGSDRRLDDERIVKGSVGLVGGGQVRWQMETFVPGSSTPEWSSEAVQIGGTGSAVGLLGMWTGARHQRADPLGPFWAWKVG